MHLLLATSKARAISRLGDHRPSVLARSRAVEVAVKRKRGSDHGSTETPATIENER
jgi:hypothetical protein